VLSFDLAARELSDDGLFVLEVDTLEKRVPSWVRDELAPVGTAGVSVDAIEFAALAGGPTAKLDTPPGLLSTGTLGDMEGGSPIRTPFFVVNPSPARELLVLHLSATLGRQARRLPLIRRAAGPAVPTETEKSGSEPATMPDDEPGSPRSRITIRRIGRAATPPGVVVVARRLLRFVQRHEAHRWRRATMWGREQEVEPPLRQESVEDLLTSLLANGGIVVECIALEGGHARLVGLSHLGGGVLELQLSVSVPAPVLIGLRVDPVVAEATGLTRRHSLLWSASLGG
jgi:hypothetical protein